MLANNLRTIRKMLVNTLVNNMNTEPKINLSDSNELLMNGVREYNENYPVSVQLITDESLSYFCDSKNEKINHGLNRLVISALNEGGHNSTQVDLIDLLKYVKTNFSEFWNSI